MSRRWPSREHSSLSLLASHQSPAMGKGEEWLAALFVSDLRCLPPRITSGHRWASVSTSGSPSLLPQPQQCKRTSLASLENTLKTLTLVLTARVWQPAAHTSTSFESVQSSVRNLKGSWVKRSVLFRLSGLLPCSRRASQWLSRLNIKTEGRKGRTE